MLIADAPQSARPQEVRLRSRIRLAAIALIAVALLIRGWVAVTGDFYFDDLILVGRGATNPLFSADLLLYDHDGHFMPAAFLVAAIATKVAPLQWFLPALMLIVLQAAAALAVLRLLRLLLGDRPVLLLPLAWYVFTPLTLPSFAWWAAALNSLPLQFALAWVAGDAIRLARTGRIRFAVSGTVVTAVALSFFEKSVLVPFVAFAVVALMYRVDGRRNPVRTVLREGRALWAASAVLLACWAVLYLLVTDARSVFGTLARASELVWHTTSLGLVPTLVGGPARWERWPPSPPFATPPTALVWAGWLMLVVGIAVAVYWKRRVGAIWLCVVGYVALCVAAMITTRSGADTADELGQTLRYVADCAVVVAIALALTARAPRRAGRVAPRAVPMVAVVLAAVFVALSTVSTLAFTRSWRDNPTTDYLDTARAELAAHRDVPLLDQPVSIWVLLPVTFPNNSAARIFAPLRDRPEFAASTPELRALDDQGRLVQASVTWTRSIPQGPDPDCGFRVSEPTSVPLDGPLMQWDWTAQLNYFADREGTVEVGLPGGDPVAVPLEAGLHQVYVRLAGQGSELHLRPLTSGLSMCLGAGPVGAVVPGQAPVSSPANSRDGG